MTGLHALLRGVGVVLLAVAALAASAAAGAALSAHRSEVAGKPTASPTASLPPRDSAPPKAADASRPPTPSSAPPVPRALQGAPCPVVVTSPQPTALAFTAPGPRFRLSGSFSRDGAPLARATVALFQGGYVSRESYFGALATTTTDASGRFSFAVSAGTYRLQAVAVNAPGGPAGSWYGGGWAFGNRATKDVPVKDRDVSGIDILALSRVALGAAVTREGRPVAEGTVRALAIAPCQNWETDSMPDGFGTIKAGVFQLSLLPGHYVLRIDLPDGSGAWYPPALDAQPLDVHADTALRIELP